jgi:hypothetical protein
VSKEPVSKVQNTPKHLLSLAGEYRVCSELNKRGVFATVTYGNQKSVDLYVISNRHESALKIEVKTSQKPNFVTGIGQKWNRRSKHPDPPDFWVLVQILCGADGFFKESFFGLTHREICRNQFARNHAFNKRYKRLHRGREFDISKGVDRLPLTDVAEFKDKWLKIVNDERLKGMRS